jgi:hypothetical protein
MQQHLMNKWHQVAFAKNDIARVQMIELEWCILFLSVFRRGKGGRKNLQPAPENCWILESLQNASDRPACNAQPHYLKLLKCGRSRLTQHELGEYGFYQ